MNLLHERSPERCFARRATSPPAHVLSGTSDRCGHSRVLEFRYCFADIASEGMVGYDRLGIYRFARRIGATQGDADGNESMSERRGQVPDLSGALGFVCGQKRE